MKTLNLEQLREIAEQARNEVYENHKEDEFSTPMQIHEGYCPEFAKAMKTRLDAEGYTSIIVVTDNFELMDELEGYETELAEYSGDSHCYLKVEDNYSTFFFDAFDVGGVDDETYMAYHNVY